MFMYINIFTMSWNINTYVLITDYSSTIAVWFQVHCYLTLLIMMWKSFKKSVFRYHVNILILGQIIKMSCLEFFVREKKWKFYTKNWYAWCKQCNMRIQQYDTWSKRLCFMDFLVKLGRILCLYTKYLYMRKIFCNMSTVTLLYLFSLDQGWWRFVFNKHIINFVWHVYIKYIL